MTDMRPVSVGGGDCMANDGSNKKRFQPGFPGTCPFVTTVSAASIVPLRQITNSFQVGSTTHIPERVVNFSSGGFSNTFPRPSYQDAAVTTYLQAIGGMYSGLYKYVYSNMLNNVLIVNISSPFSASGRGVPDIAAQGTRFKVILGGETKAIGGTSASTPVSIKCIIRMAHEHTTNRSSRQ